MTPKYPKIFTGLCTREGDGGEFASCLEGGKEKPWKSLTSIWLLGGVSGWEMSLLRLGLGLIHFSYQRNLVLLSIWLYGWSRGRRTSL